MDEAGIIAADQSAWWEQTLDYVIRSAADSRFGANSLQNYGTYGVDANGRIWQNGQPATAAAVASQAPQWVWIAAAALGAVLVLKLLKG